MGGECSIHQAVAGCGEVSPGVQSSLLLGSICHDRKIGWLICGVSSQKNWEDWREDGRLMPRSHLFCYTYSAISRFVFSSVLSAQPPILTSLTKSTCSRAVVFLCISFPLFLTS